MNKKSKKNVNLNPQFSVIIPVLNGEKTISRAIKSVLKQTYPAKEIIVVDGGSTDKTQKKVAKFGKKVNYTYEKSMGISEARNKGATVAKSEWLTFLDADDYYYPNRLKWHAQLIQKHSDLDFLTGDIEIKKPNGQLIMKTMENTKAGKEILKEAKGNLTTVMKKMQVENFIEDHFGQTSTLTVPRKKLLKVGGYPEGIQIAEDLVLLIKLCAESKKIGVICKPMSVYQFREGSTVRKNYLNTQKETLKAFLKLKKELKKAPIHIKRGLQKRINDTRLSLAYALLKEGKRISAVKAILPTKNIKEILSVAKGIKK